MFKIEAPVLILPTAGARLAIGVYLQGHEFQETSCGLAAGGGDARGTTIEVDATADIMDGWSGSITVRWRVGPDITLGDDRRE
jgi:hypothetical protein